MTPDDLLAGATDPIVVRDHGPVRIIVLNRPAKRNALSRDMRRGFARAIVDADDDDGVAAMILTGAGGHFTAGLDTSEPADPGVAIAVRPHPGEAALAAAKPLIAAVDGACVTGGLELALSCSFIVATDRARFADTHAKIGAFPHWGQAALLPRAIGIRRARQMATTGAFIDAATALAWGLVNEVVAPATLIDRCIAIAEGIAACNRESVARQLALMAETDGAPLAIALDAGDAAAARWASRKLV